MASLFDNDKERLEKAERLNAPDAVYLVTYGEITSLFGWRKLSHEEFQQLMALCAPTVSKYERRWRRSTRRSTRTTDPRSQESGVMTWHEFKFFLAGVVVGMNIVVLLWRWEQRRRRRMK